nr:type II secretion system F family protein [uncultured Rhodopila sp.]
MIASMADQVATIRFAMLALLLICAGAAILLRYAIRRDRIVRRLRDAAAGSHRRADIDAASIFTSTTRMISMFGHSIAGSGLLSGRALDGIQKKLTGAGIRGGNAIGLFIASKIILMLLLPLATVAVLPAPGLSSGLGKLAVAAVIAAGLLLPDWFLRMVQNHYVAGVERGLPDVLDMLVMCTESGLSLEPAILRVGTEVRGVHPAVASELLLTAGELHILADSRIALENLGDRTGVAGLQRVARTLIQTLQYGTPLASTLRSLTAEMRQEMLTRFTERSGRLPALLTVVMIVFILPSLFLLIGGPAMIQVFRQFGK